MKRYLAFLLLICICLCCISCYRSGSLGASGYYEAYAIARFSVPFFVDLGDDASNFDQVKLLERDEYGRSLFAYNYWLWSLATENAEYASLLIVCQSVSVEKDKDLVIGWYDECWIVKPSEAKEFASFENTEIEKLKEQNDWGKPLDESRINTSHYYKNTKYKRFWEDKEKRETDRSNLGDAANTHFSDNKAVGTIVYKYGNGYSLIVISNTELVFVCFDLSQKVFVREQRFDGNIFECRNEFIEFMNDNSIGK